jgi:hypothetical protein
MPTKTIHVMTPFKLTIEGKPGSEGVPAEPPRTVVLGAGMQTVDAEVADHWYTKAHLSNGGLGAQAYAEAQRAQADQAFVKTKEATAIWLSFERATVDAEVAAGMDLTSPAHERLAPSEADMEIMSPAGLEHYRETAQSELDARAPAEAEREDDEFDAMSDDQLRELITIRDGKAPRFNTGRAKLLLAARGDKGTAADIENGASGS